MLNAVIGLAIGLSVAFPILVIATNNLVTGLLATLTLVCITVTVAGTIHAAGWNLGVSRGGSVGRGGGSGREGMREGEGRGRRDRGGVRQWVREGWMRERGVGDGRGGGSGEGWGKEGVRLAKGTGKGEREVGRGEKGE